MKSKFTFTRIKPSIFILSLLVFLLLGLSACKTEDEVVEDATTTDTTDPVSPTLGLTSTISGNTSEDGATANFTLKLNTAPDGDVLVKLSSLDTSEGTIDTPTMNFTAQNWNTAQSAIVTGVNESDVDGDITYAIQLSIDTLLTTDTTGYDALAVTSVELVNLDNEVAGVTPAFVLSMISNNTGENGTTANFTVQLNTAPTNDVLIDLNTSDATEGTVTPTTMNFTSSDWNIPQIATVNGVNDTIVDGDIPYTIDVSINSSTDTNYASLTSSPVNVLNLDDDALVITEVGSTYYTDSSFWFEVYNNSTESANLDQYTLKSYSTYYTTAWNDGGVTSFSLPSVVIPAGGYLVVRAKAYDSWGSLDSDQVVYIKDSSGYIPYWHDSGFLELLKDGVTADFVRFGTDATTPTTSTAWNGGDAPALPAATTLDYGYSIARDGSNSDSNSNTDWVLRSFATPGGPNDVTCDTDADNDGIPDCSEVDGSTFAGLSLYAWGARIGQKDIFIEVDYMDSTDAGVTPRKEALQKVVDAFLAKGYALHFDVGDLYDQATGTDPADFDLGGGEKVPYAAGIALGEATGLANFYEYKTQYMKLARKQIFHYMLFANSQNADGSSGSSGIAEVNGNDLIISLGNWGLNDTTYLNYLINWQAATVMHEFGHNLGLLHGGNENTNYKPNYVSIMNYLYQLNGLPTIGTNEGDRYYFKNYYNNALCGTYNEYSDLTNPPSGSSTAFLMDYSDGSGSNLVETSVAESSGLGRSGSTSVDFDCDGAANETLSYFNLNPYGDTTTTSTLTDYDDWTNINLFFQRYYSGDFTGISLTSQVWHDPVGNDRQEIMVETPPSPEFFQRLKMELQNQR